MTYKELAAASRRILSESGIDSYAYDTMCLLEHFFSVGRVDMVQKANESPSAESEQQFLTAVRKRSGGYPLQYILGKWTFMGGEYFVGEGVLIPRDDTEVCVRACIKSLELLQSLRTCQNLRIIDLCSGSGIIAVTLAKHFPTAEVYALELSETAFSCLAKNIVHNGVENVTAINDDIFTAYDRFEDTAFDLIVSNPTYIETNVIPALQKEVQFEPSLALDGGADGLKFYRAIARHWLKKLTHGGIISLEIGEEQGKAVSELLKQGDISDIQILKDIQNLNRAVFGTKN